MITLSKTKLEKINTIFASIIKEVSPTPEELELVASYSNEIVSRLKAVVPNDVEILATGSIAHGTQVKNSYDIDLFLLFPRNLSRKELEKRGLEYAKWIVNEKKNESYIIKYAEHPYVKLILKDLGTTADIVPAYKIKNASERITAVDRSQLHNEFINEHLTKEQKNEVRVLKTFLKSHYIYGSDVKTEGFSGYLCEILIYTYGSLLNLFSHFYNMDIPVVIDPLNKIIYERDSTETKVLTKKFNSEFIVIDPVDQNRNVAAVVSKESLAKFIFAVRYFLNNPLTATFYGQKFSDLYSKQKVKNFSKKLGLSIFVLHFKVPNIAEDILWQQIKKLKGTISDALKKHGFTPVLSLENIFVDDGIIAFFINDIKIKYSIINGPQVYMYEAFDKFLKAHKTSLGFIFESDKIQSIEEAKYTDAKEIIINLIKNTELPSYLKKENLKIYKDNIPENIAKLIYSAFITKTLH
ncbi:MAG: CCA tRNA nucleotidyltransferase [Candidatus Micrarchaeia archaeon]